MEHAVSVFTCALCDAYQQQKYVMNQMVELLFKSTEITHTVMIVIDTAGRVLFRNIGTRDWIKRGSGGGKYNKSLIHCHFSCREGVYDEFGISFTNRAVMEVSQTTHYGRSTALVRFLG